MPVDALAAAMRECFEAAGLSRQDARIVADVLADANLRGIDSHGLVRLPAYLRRVAAGTARGGEGMTVVGARGGARRIDAGHALGPVAAVGATDAAVELARTHGIGLVAVGNSTHLGVAGFYARRAARAGAIAIVVTNGPGTMAPHGAVQPFLGTNALAIGVPLGRHGEFVLDMSSSATARGKIIRAAALGERIEPGLAIDAEGRPTDDPLAALAGAVLPMAGPKGSGLALAISLLASTLAGADADDELAPLHGPPDRPQNVGHVFIAIDRSWALAGAGEHARAEQLIARLHRLQPAPGHERVRFPGERSDALAAERTRAGIPLARAELAAAAAACEQVGLPRAAERFRALG